MDLDALSEYYPQVDMDQYHKLHIKVTMEQKNKLVILADKMKFSESKICVKAIMTQMPRLEERLVDYNYMDFKRKVGGFNADIDIVLPPQLYLQLLFYKETFQSFSFGILVRMMLDDFLVTIDEKKDETVILEVIAEHKAVITESHRLFLDIRRSIKELSRCIVIRIEKFSAGLSDEMKKYWASLAAA